MFLVDVKPYRKELQVFKEGHGIPSDPNKLRAILDVFDKHIKFAEYPDALPTKMSCGGCISNAFNRLLGKIQREGHEPIKLTPNIPPLKPISKHEKTAQEVTKKNKALRDNPLSKEEMILNLQEALKEKKVKFHHKAGVKKLTELLEANS